MKWFLSLPIAACALAACSTAPADEAPLEGNWALDGAESQINFVTVKGGAVAEVHSFAGLEGSVTADGAAEVDIDLASVETNVDVRNERMKEFLFETGVFPRAIITAQFDPAEMGALVSGETKVVSTNLGLNLHGNEGEVPAVLLVTRIAPGKVRVVTASPIIIEAASFGLDTGVEKLRELVNLDSITGAVPVTASLTFTQATE